MPKRKRAVVVSHYMHEAARSANIVGRLSIIRAIILMAINYAVRLHNGGTDIRDASMQNVLLYYALPAVLFDWTGVANGSQRAVGFCGLYDSVDWNDHAHHHFHSGLPRCPY